MDIPEVIARPTPVVAMGRLIGLMIVLFLIYAGFIFGTDYVEMARSSPFFQVVELDVFMFFTIALIIILSTLILLVRWSFERYELRGGEIIHRKGVIFVRVEQYSLENVETITYDQTLFGRVLKYGTIRLHSPLLKSEIKVPYMPDPDRVLMLLKSAIGKTAEKIVPMG